MNYIHTLNGGQTFIDYGPVSMVITAKIGNKICRDLAEEAFPIIKDVLSKIAEVLPVLRLYPAKIDVNLLSGIPKLMAQAALAVGEPTLTPMASVAGAIADSVADWIFAQGADTVIVNNGGDVAIRLKPGQSIKVGILPCQNNRNITKVIQISAKDGIGGICTSGLGGRSFTCGIANAVTVFSEKCAIADSCATHIANCSFIDSPRVHTVKAKQIDPDSDIADLNVVSAVECLTDEEIDRGLKQIKWAADIQKNKGNLIWVAADIQGRQMHYGIN
jgi:ApbE superfamily uncharacterized protein (UPF0280 family)